jgi:hypothetical protein
LFGTERKIMKSDNRPEKTEFLYRKESLLAVVSTF